MSVERAVFRACYRALRGVAQRLPKESPPRWGASLRAAAASAHFVAEETFPAGPFLDLERWLREAFSGAARPGARMRAVGGGDDAEAARRFGALHGELAADGGDPVDVGLAAVRLIGAYDALLSALEKEGVLEEPSPKLREPGVLFAVGDVLRHRFFGRCVVVGWASTCPMSEEWITGNRIRENLVNGPGQPFYHVLLEENHLPRCVSQENCALEAPPAGRKLVIPESFDHYGIPYYFSQTEAEDENAREAGADREMTISDELKQCYPEDDAFRISQDRDFRTLEEAHRPPYLRRAEEEA